MSSETWILKVVQNSVSVITVVGLVSEGVGKLGREFFEGGNVPLIARQM